MADRAWLTSLIRDIPDFPTPGVGFKDITPLLGDADGLRFAVDCLADEFVADEVDAVVGIEARGFVFGAPVAYRMGVPFVPIRKPGKLPSATVSVDYDLEYGSDTLEMHADALVGSSRAVIIDDVLATGGTARAAARLVEQLGARVHAFGFLLVLDGLGGREAIDGYPVVSLLDVDLGG